MFKNIFKNIKRPLLLIMALLIVLTSIGMPIFADEDLSVDYGSLDTEPGFNWWEDVSTPENDLTSSEPGESSSTDGSQSEESSSADESQPEESSSSDGSQSELPEESSPGDSSDSTTSSETGKEETGSSSVQAPQETSVIDSGAPQLPNPLTIPITLENKRTRDAGADSLSISWFPAYTYNFTIAPGYPIYGEWCSYKINGKLVYCLEPKNLVSTDGAIYQSTTTWNALDYGQKKLVSYVLLYGASSDGNIPEHIATQALIWEIALSYRDSTFTRTSNYVYNGIIAGSAAETYYNQIADKVTNHKKIPSFMSDSDAAMPTYVLAEKDGKYTFEVTDTRNVLADMTLPSISGVSFQKSGNKLTITSDHEIDPAQMVKSAKTGTEGGSGNPLVFWVSNGGTAEQAKVGMDGNPDPVEGFFKISTSGEGGVTPPPTPGDDEYKITIIKRVEGTGELLPGATFDPI